jgi:hypothetical protein
MSSSLFPPDGSQIELEAAGVLHPSVRLVSASARVVTVSLPLAHVPLMGATVTLRWIAPPRGKYAVVATVIGIDENRVELRPEGEPEITQSRRYVRGGGGEPVVMTRSGRPDADGSVLDISERSVRASFTDVELQPGDKATIQVQLGEDQLKLSATVAKARSIRPKESSEDPPLVEVIALYDPIESQAQIIRRYVMQHQLLMRAKAMGAD